MKDVDKTKQQLIAELSELRQQIAVLEVFKTERNQADDALRESELRHRQLVETMNEGMALADQNYIFTFVNERFCEMLGYSRDEMLGHHLTEFVHDDDKALMKDQMARRKSGEAQRFELAWRKKDGRKMQTLVSPRGFFDGEGLFKGSLGVLTDITALKKAEAELQKAHDELERRVEQRTAELARANEQLKHEIEERKWALQRLRASEEKYRSLVDNIAIGVALISPNMEILALNNKIKEWFPEIDPQKRPLCYRSFNDPPREEVCSYCPTIKTLLDGKVHEAITDTPAGDKRKNYRIISSPIKDEQGEVIAAIESVEDITDLRQTEEALRESEEKFRQAFENANIGMCLVDAEGRFTEINNQMCEILGYSREEFETMSVNDITHPNYLDVSSEFIQRASSGEITHAEFEKQYYHKKGHIVWGQVSSSLVRDVNGMPLYFISHVKDITERKRDQEQLFAYQSQLRSLASELVLTEERERRRLAMDLHDSIGQTLAISRIKLDELQSASSSLAHIEALDDVCKQIAQAIQQTRSLTFDLSPPALYELGLEAALESLVERMQQKHSLIFQFKDDKRPKPLNQHLAILLFRAVRELLINVVKHARARSVRTFIEANAGEVRITVEDDGVGFDISNIESYYSSGKLGLLSIKERLHHLGGRFEVFSRLGQGTHVTLSAPLKSVPQRV